MMKAVEEFGNSSAICSGTPRRPKVRVAPQNLVRKVDTKTELRELLGIPVYLYNGNEATYELIKNYDAEAAYRDPSIPPTR